MTHADYHPCSEGCGRDSELSGPCEECDMRRRLPTPQYAISDDAGEWARGQRSDMQTRLADMIAGNEATAAKANLRVTLAAGAEAGPQVRLVMNARQTRRSALALATALDLVAPVAGRRWTAICVWCLERFDPMREAPHHRLHTGYMSASDSFAGGCSHCPGSGRDVLVAALPLALLQRSGEAA